MLKAILSSIIVLSLVLISGLPASAIKAFKRPSDADLREHVYKLYNKPASGSCTAVAIVTDDGRPYVVSAGHCLGIFNENGQAYLQGEDGKEHLTVVIAEDPNSDLILITSPKDTGARIAKNIPAHSTLIAMTYGGGYPSHKAGGEALANEVIDIPLSIIGSEKDLEKCLSMPKHRAAEMSVFIFTIQVCVLSIPTVATTVKVERGSSGGPMFNDEGELAGTVVGGDEEFNYIVPARDIRKFIASLPL